MDLWKFLNKVIMKQFKSILILWLIVASCNAQSHGLNQSNYNFEFDSINFEGDWVMNETPETLYIEQDTAYLSVIDGQIHIKALIYYSLKSKNKAFLKLIEPTLLGLGGARLKWENFSLEKNLVELTLLSNDSLRFEWLGFCDKELKQSVFPVCGFTSDKQNWCYLTRDN